VGIGAEPASCCSIAGAKKLVEKGVIHPDELVIGILTGHLLKDPEAVIRYHTGDLKSLGIESRYANAPIRIEPTLDAVREALYEVRRVSR